MLSGKVKLVIDATPGYEPYDRQRIIEQNKKNAVRHAYFREYLTKHGLKIPADAADYDGFAARMRINEQEFVRAFS